MTCTGKISPLCGFVALAFGVATAWAGEKDSIGLVWPPPPQKPRIKHVQTIASAGDIAGEEGFFSKVLRFVSGERRPTQWLVQPVGIAVAPDGRIYVADPGVRGVHIVDRKKGEHDLIVRSKFGSLDSPVGVCITPDGGFVIADSKLGEVVVFDRNNRAVSRIKDRLTRPTGVSLVDGKMYVVDTGQHKVLVFDLKGNFLFEFGERGTEDGQWNYPTQIIAGNTVAIVDAMNYRIQRMSLGGEFLSQFGSQGTVAGFFSHPKGVAFDSDENIYVTDGLMDVFQIFDTMGQLLLVVGGPGGQGTLFAGPNGIAIDQNDLIYVVDTFGRRVQVFRYLK